jgi:protein-disulfide isomerase/uncharacterized membrane protein
MKIKQVPYLLIFLVSCFELILSWNKDFFSCDINSYFSCSKVLSSGYAYIGPMPLAVLGVLFGLLGFIRYKKGDVLLFIINCASLLFLAYSLFTMVFLIKALCVFCLFVDLCVLLNFILNIKFKSLPIEKDWPQDLGISLASFALILSVLYLYSHHKAPVSEEQITLLESPLILGNPNGSLEVVVFTDFQCPACKKGSELVKVLLKDKRIKLSIKNYPLSSQCNQGMKTDLHPWSCEAAKLSFCAHEQGKFKEYYELIYSVQEEIKKPSDIYQLLEIGSFNLEELLSCSSGSYAEERLFDDVSEGTNLKLDGTPSFFFQGKKVRDWTNPYVWDELLQKAK